MWTVRPTGARRPASPEAGSPRAQREAKGPIGKGTKDTEACQRPLLGKPRQMPLRCRTQEGTRTRAEGKPGPGHAGPCLWHRAARQLFGGEARETSEGGVFILLQEATHSRAAAADARVTRGAHGPPDVRPGRLTVTRSSGLTPTRWAQPASESSGPRGRPARGPSGLESLVTLGLRTNSFSACCAPEMGVIKLVTQGHHVI